MGFNMYLKQNEEYKSIQNLSPARIGDFSIITGANGSGKSQLLEAIAQGHIQVFADEKEEHALQAQLFTHDSFIENATALSQDAKAWQCIKDMAQKLGIPLENESKIEELSSGEKAIVAMMMTLSDLENQQHTVPELILFDEVELSLHPKMNKLFLEEVVTKQLVQRGSRVIMISHSPTTIAIASALQCLSDICTIKPTEPKIYEMMRYANQKSGLKAISAERAVDSLLEGVREVHIKKQSRKIVYCESYKDEGRYKRIYKTWLRYRSSPMVELDFRAIESSYDCGKTMSMLKGLVDSNKHREIREVIMRFPSGGKEAIKRHIEQHHPYDQSVVGLLDWDKKEHSEKGLYILAEGRRYGIENLLLDPFFLLCYLLQTDHRFRKHDLREYLKNPKNLQYLMDKEIIKKLKFNHKINLHDDVKCRYGLRSHRITLYIPRQVLQMNGHRYVGIVLKSKIINFPSGDSDPDGLFGLIINKVILNNLPYVMPAELDWLFSYMSKKIS